MAILSLDSGPDNVYIVWALDCKLEGMKLFLTALSNGALLVAVQIRTYCIMMILKLYRDYCNNP